MSHSENIAFLRAYELRRIKIRLIRFWRSLNISLMPQDYTGHHIWVSDGDADVIIWIHRVWISWNWGHKWPRANRL